jgi:hypothetical protein
MFPLNLNVNINISREGSMSAGRIARNAWWKWALSREWKT